MDDWVGLEMKTLGARQFLTLRIVNRQHGFEPTRHRVGEIRNQRASTGSDDELLAARGRKTIAVHATGHDLTIDEDG